MQLLGCLRRYNGGCTIMLLPLLVDHNREEVVHPVATDKQTVRLTSEAAAL